MWIWMRWWQWITNKLNLGFCQSWLIWACYLFLWWPALPTVQAISRVDIMLKWGNSMGNSARKVIIGSCYAAWYTEHSGVTFVRASQILRKTCQFSVHDSNIWQSIQHDISPYSYTTYSSWWIVCHDLFDCMCLVHSNRCCLCKFLGLYLTQQHCHWVQTLIFVSAFMLMYWIYCLWNMCSIYSSSSFLLLLLLLVFPVCEPPVGSTWQSL